MNKRMLREVVKNAKQLDKLMPVLLKKKRNVGRYVVFHKGEHHIVHSLGCGVELGKAEFGAAAGFVVRLISTETPVC